MSQIVLTGQTIRITNIFFDFMDNKIDPEIIKFKIYDYNYSLIEEIILGEGNKLEKGTYFYDFIPSGINKKYIVEFYGEIDGNPSFDRKVIITKFIRE